MATLSVLAALTVPLAGCAKVPGEEEQGEKAAKVEKADGGQSKVILIEEAAKRLGIETAEVAPLPAGRESVPYSAVIYDAEGNSWVFTTGEELSYVKAPITIDRIEGDTAILAEGPPVGTAVVSQGAEELFGVEDGIGEFE
ncbi:MAG TPA: hypothetical protein VG034_11550 [Acidimicrobiia bacterium]|nr:hypothetical protein [Acidimicrobiia bacterium]